MYKHILGRAPTISKLYQVFFFCYQKMVQCVGLKLGWTVPYDIKNPKKREKCNKCNKYIRWEAIILNLI